MAVQTRPTGSRRPDQRDAPGAPPRVARAPWRLGWGVWLAGLALLVFALGLRLYGANFGLPYSGYYWDEPSVVNRAVRFGSGDLNPHFFYYPAFYMYVLFVAIGAYGVLGMATGHFKGIDGFAIQYFLDPSEFYLVARAVTAVVGAASVLLLAWLGRRWFGPLAGWLAGLFLAVAVLHATHSQIAITDVPQAFFVIAAGWPLLSIVERRRWRSYLAAGLLIGLGAATKYLAILLVPSLMLAHLLADGRPAWRPFRWRAWLGYAVSPTLLAGLAAVFVGFFIGTPFNIIDFPEFIRSGQTQAQLSGGDGSIDPFYLVRLLPSDLGWPLVVAALAGLPLIVRRLGRRGVVLLTFPLLYLVFMMFFAKLFARYLILLEPFLALAAGLAVATVAEAVARRLPSGAPRWLAAGGLGLVVAGLIILPLTATLRWKTMVGQETDPRTAAVRWMHASVAPGTLIAVQPLFGKTFFNAPVLTDRGLDDLRNDIPGSGRFERIRQQVIAELSARPVYREVEFAYDYDRLRTAGARYVLVSNQNWWPVLAGLVPPDSPEARFKQALDTRARVAAVFRPATDMPALWPGASDIFPYLPPEITIYELVN